MKLKWPLWLIVTCWLILHLVGFLSFPYGSPLNVTGLGFVPAAFIYLLYGAFAQSVGYGVIVGKKTLDAWKTQVKDYTPAPEPNADNPHQLAMGFLYWLLLPMIIYIPFLIIAISER